MPPKKVVDPTRAELCEKIFSQVSNLSDIRLRLLRSTEPPKRLKQDIVNAINNYVDREGRPLVGDDAVRMADQMIAHRKFDLNNALVSNKTWEKPYRGPRLKSGEVAESREVTAEDIIADAKPTFNTPEDAES